jgi:hypothetical protein
MHLAGNHTACASSLNRLKRFSHNQGHAFSINILYLLPNQLHPQSCDLRIVHLLRPQSPSFAARVSSQLSRVFSIPSASVGKMSNQLSNRAALLCARQSRR